MSEVLCKDCLLDVYGLSIKENKKINKGICLECVHKKWRKNRAVFNLLFQQLQLKDCLDLNKCPGPKSVN